MDNLLVKNLATVELSLPSYRFCPSRTPSSAKLILSKWCPMITQKKQHRTIIVCLYYMGSLLQSAVIFYDYNLMRSS